MPFSFLFQNYEATTIIAVWATTSATIFGLILFHRRCRSCQGGDEPLVVGVLGAGAVGTVAGLKLLHSDQIRRVVLVGRSTLEEQVKKAENQLTLHENYIGGSTKTYVADGIRLQVVDGTQEDALKCLVDCNVILIATKTVATSQVAADLAQKLPRNSTATIILLQNGLNNIATLRHTITAEEYPDVKILQAVVAFPAEWEEYSTNFQINLHGGKMFIEKCYQELHSSRVRTLIHSWTKANLTSTQSSRIVLLKYTKLLSNLINPLNALAGVSVPVQMMDREYRILLASAIMEATEVLGQYDAILAKSQIDKLLFQIAGGWIMPFLLTRLPDRFYRRIFGDAADGNDSAFGTNYKSSTLQDLERRRPKTEIDELCGATVRLAQTHGIATPVHSTLMDMIHEAEQAQKGSPKLRSDEVLRKIDSKR